MKGIWIAAILALLGQSFAFHISSPSIARHAKTHTGSRPWAKQTHSPRKHESLSTALLGANDELVALAYDWTVNLGAPAALVAGAVVATIYETHSSGSLEWEKGDKKWAKIAKSGTTFLLVSAFVLEVVSIFTTTITGTMLLSRASDGLPCAAGTALGFLRQHFEFEYLASRVSFLQGLLNWLAAIALEYTVPRDESASTRIRNNFIASGIMTLILFMLSFYNGHATFYKNYFHMLSRLCKVTWLRYFWRWPMRPMVVVAIPAMALTATFGYQVVQDILHPEDPEHEKEKE